MKALKVLALLTLTFFILTEPCYANPVPFGWVPVNWEGTASWTAFAILIVIAPFVEAWIIVRMSSGRARGTRNLSRFFWVLVAMNVITVAITQVLAYEIAFSWSHTPPFGYLAEIFPLAVEYLLLRWLFTRLYESGMFANPFTNKEVARMTLLANLVTFLGGIAFIFGLMT